MPASPRKQANRIVVRRKEAARPCYAGGCPVEERSTTMHTPPPEEGNSGRPDEQRGPAPAPPEAAPGDATDLFFDPNAEPSDDTPTVISRGVPRPAASEDVFSGTLRGRRLAHFELIEPIGVGGMAAVIRSRDLQLERQVALKILPPEMAADPENVRRFQQEARAAAKLDHENIARVFFCGEDQKLHFIAFEFVEGQNLRTLLERRGRLPVSEAIHYMLQIATGLAHAGERGVIHRDIKPSNIIISPNGRAKLVDMGLARQLGRTLDQGLTQSGVTLGTFDYISPEQALEPRDADVRSDIYSLGCTFYHVLTGQPPVPEGTAAKKLHCHQHVAPLDPRQLNPDIPDDVAAILGRMMAKDAKDRYQRPEHLVQHLLLVAQQLGVAADVPEGVLFVDAPLPAPPRPRPVLLALAAAAGVVALVVLLGQVPRPTTPAPEPVAIGAGDPQPQPSNTATTVKTAPDKPSEGGPTNPEVVRGGPAAAPLPLLGDASSAKDAQEFLARPFETDHPTHKLQLEGTLDLGKEDLGQTGPGLVFDGKTGSTLVIEPKDKNPKQRPVIRIRPDANSRSGLWAALKVQSGRVKLSGLRFEIDANQVSSITMAALYCQGGRIEVENCEFVQSLPPEDGSSRISAVEVAQSGDTSLPAVTFSRCCFLRAPQEIAAGTGLAGQNVATLTAAGSVDLTDCAFGPHAAVVAFQGAGPDDGPRGALARLIHCTGLLSGDAAVVRLENASRCEVRATSCLFWAPGSAMEEGAPAGTLVRQVTGLSDALGRWSGQNNRYYNLAAFWQQPEADEPVRGLAPFVDKVNGTGGQERGSQALAVLPSRTEDPFQHLDADAPEDLWQAFQPDVRLADLRDGTKKGGLIGVEHLLDAKDAYTANLPSLKEAVVAQGRRVVDPSVKVASNGVYPTLAAAVVDARPGDVIELRFNGSQTVSNAIRLDQPDLADVTIRPYAGYHPVLVLGPTNPEDEEAALFRLYDGKLKLERLQFQLKPSNDTAVLQAVVCLVGDGSCTFSDCVVTLEQTNGTRLAAVAVADLPAAMKDNRMARPAGQRAGATFKNCVVRGDGDLVADRAGRPVSVDGDNVLLALGRSVLNLDAAGDDLPAAFAGASASLKLGHTTAYLGGNLVHFRADKDVRGLVPVQVSSSNCLFLAAATPPPGNTNKPLIHLDGPDTSEERMKQLLQWTGQGNAYTNFSSMLDQSSGGSEMPAMPYNQTRWKELTKETDALFDRVKLVESPAADLVLARATPAQFRVKADPDQQGYGADVVQLARLFPPDGMTRAEK